MTSRIRVPVKTVENRGKTVWLVGVNRKETVNQPYTGHCRAMPSTTERLLCLAHKSLDFLGEATTTSRLTLGLLNLSPVLLWTPWYKVFLRRDPAVQRFPDLYADRSGRRRVIRVKGHTVTPA